jgi:hypothetical protein
LEKYSSISASDNGRRLVASVSNPTANLWSLPISDRVAEQSDLKPYPLPTVRGLAPRFAGDVLFYLSSRGTGDGLWRLKGTEGVEIWKSSEGALLDPAAVSRDGTRVAIVLRRNGRVHLKILTAEGNEVQTLSDIDARGTADWSPDNREIVTGGIGEQGVGLYKISLSGGAPVRLVEGLAVNPVWSPDGNLIVYFGPNVGGNQPLLAVRPDGTRVNLPMIQVIGGGARARFLPDGRGLLYMFGPGSAMDFWELDLASMKTRQITRIGLTSLSTTAFDITADAKQIVFERLRENSDLVLIDLPSVK